MMCGFHNALDNVLRNLRARGVTSERLELKHLEEERLWRSGVLWGASTWKYRKEKNKS